MENTKSNLLREVRKAKETITDKYLRDNLETLKNSANNLLQALSSYPADSLSAFSDIEFIRLLQKN